MSYRSDLQVAMERAMFLERALETAKKRIEELEAMLESSEVPGSPMGFEPPELYGVTSTGETLRLELVKCEVRTDGPHPVLYVQGLGRARPKRYVVVELITVVMGIRIRKGLLDLAREWPPGTNIYIDQEVTLHG